MLLRLRISILTTLISISLPSLGLAVPILETQTFDSEASAAAAGWTGFRNVNPAIPRSYGFSNTNYAGGGSGSGEAGGIVQTSNHPDSSQTNYYADLTIGEVTLDDPLTISGRLFAEFDLASGVQSAGSFRLGFFLAETEFLGGTNFLGLSFYRTSSSPPINYLVSVGKQIANASTGGGLDSGIYDFNLSWDPDGGINGTGGISFQFIDENNVLVADGLLSTNAAVAAGLSGMKFDAFGMRFGDPDGDSTAKFFVDDLSYSVTPEPSTAILLAIGIAGIAVIRRRSYFA